MDKRTLRAHLKGRKVDEAISERICSQLLSDKELEKAERLFLYYPLPDEVDIRALYCLGARIALPFMREGNQMGYALYNGALKEGRFSLMEPEAKQEVFPTQKDIMIVPAVAFTPAGERIGRGLGCYDRYLAQHKVRTIGVVSKERIIPVEDIQSYDTRVDRLLCEEGFLF